MASLLGTAAGAVSGSKSGGSGLGYSGQNSSSISTPVTTSVSALGGAQNYNLGSAGIGNSAIPAWAWYVGAALAAFVIYKKFK